MNYLVAVQEGIRLLRLSITENGNRSVPAALDPVHDTLRSYFTINDHFYLFTTKAVRVPLRSEIAP